jgi:hypothetical protein
MPEVAMEWPEQPVPHHSKRRGVLSCCFAPRGAHGVQKNQTVCTYCRLNAASSFLVAAANAHTSQRCRLNGAEFVVISAAAKQLSVAQDQQELDARGTM